MQHYLECVSWIERLHRLFLDVVKAELDALRVRDINNVQSLILYSIAGNEISVGELTQRGYFLGSNVSYNLKKMVEAGYLEQERSPHDRRSVRVRLTEKGHGFWETLDAVFQRHVGLLAEVELTGEGLAAVCESLQRLEKFWNLARTCVPRPPEPLVGRPVSTEEAHTYFHAPRRVAATY
ncbi:MAG: winged helix DNA-binding protein [Alphaproteobacteria bacterium]|nr:winged helix DNA-binding protein [Alphaproteobacteria bacterium]MCB9929626.1 winged helix DNA-binding protein [Alphaproteobacteria bacterium]